LSDACKDGSTDYQAALRGDGGDVAEADRGQTGEHKVKGSEKVRQLRVAQVLGVVDQTIRYEEQGKHASYDASDLKNRGGESNVGMPNDVQRYKSKRTRNREQKVRNQSGT